MEHRRRIGVLVPSSDTVLEVDLWRRLPPQFTLHVARMYLESTSVAGEEKMLREELIPAARRVASIRPEIVVFGCTSAAALHGLEGDAAIARRVEMITGCPCITVVQAATREISQLGVQNLLVATPYIDELNNRLRATFEEAGLPVIKVVGLGLDNDLEIGAVPPAKIQEFVVAAVKATSPAPDCVFISCTTFRAFEAAEALELQLGIPVVTSNRSVFRAILHHPRSDAGG